MSLAANPQRWLSDFCISSMSAAAPSNWLFSSSTGLPKFPTATRSATFFADAAPLRMRPEQTAPIDKSLRIHQDVGIMGLQSKI